MSKKGEKEIKFYDLDLYSILARQMKIYSNSSFYILCFLIPKSKKIRDKFSLLKLLHSQYTTYLQENNNNLIYIYI